MSKDLYGDHICVHNKEESKRVNVEVSSEGDLPSCPVEKVWRETERRG